MKYTTVEGGVETDVPLVIAEWVWAVSALFNMLKLIPWGWLLDAPFAPPPVCPYNVSVPDTDDF